MNAELISSMVATAVFVVVIWVINYFTAAETSLPSLIIRAVVFGAVLYVVKKYIFRESKSKRK